MSVFDESPCVIQSSSVVFVTLLLLSFSSCLARSRAASSVLCRSMAMCCGEGERLWWRKGSSSTSSLGTAGELSAITSSTLLSMESL
ncbi:hypothetical protein NP493_60g00030 [Ridgeia piscesae]|uniref:Secreted protein n=1 Tax=Ridgeia piscesae TaxID=27915 RepID=A0AAD9UIZ2_RIDPI|nr:hypothetical protein NP493_60g00030 [Ridgeia piscesae]